MLAFFQDVRIELEELEEEVGRLKTEKELFSKAQNRDAEIADSHMRAMASFIHDIYTGMEKLLESLIKYFDEQLPLGGTGIANFSLGPTFPTTKCCQGDAGANRQEPS